MEGNRTNRKAMKELVVGFAEKDSKSQGETLKIIYEKVKDIAKLRDDIFREVFDRAGSIEYRCDFLVHIRGGKIFVSYPLLEYEKEFRDFDPEKFKSQMKEKRIKELRNTIKELKNHITNTEKEIKRVENL